MARRDRNWSLNDGQIRNPSARLYIVPLSNFAPRGFGFAHHSIATLYHEVPNLISRFATFASQYTAAPSAARGAARHPQRGGGRHAGSGFGRSLLPAERACGTPPPPTRGGGGGGHAARAAAAATPTGADGSGLGGEAVGATTKRARADGGAAGDTVVRRRLAVRDGA